MQRMYVTFFNIIKPLICKEEAVSDKEEAVPDKEQENEDWLISFITN